jgi:phosphate transport system permease protein
MRGGHPAGGPGQKGEEGRRPVTRRPVTGQRVLEPAGEEIPPRRVQQVLGPADVTFRGVARASGALVVTVMVLIGLFLAKQSVFAISKVGLWRFLTTQQWSVPSDFGVAALVVNTVLLALVALVVAFPLSLGTALFISEMVRGRVQRALISVIDLMAAVPTLIYGLWGLEFFESAMVPVVRWLSTWFGWIPFLRVPGINPNSALPLYSPYKASTFLAGIVVGLTIVPVMSSMMRESFTRAPIGEREGALALGATRWGMIRAVVIPFGKGGIIGGTMLGLGRALGETIVVYLIVSPIFQISFNILHVGGNSIGANIALQYAGAGKILTSALMASGLALFVLTMVINFIASMIIARSRSGAQSEV